MVCRLNGVDSRSSGSRCCVASSNLIRSNPVSYVPYWFQRSVYQKERTTRLRRSSSPTRVRNGRIWLQVVQEEQRRRNQQVIFRFTFHEHEGSSASITGLISVSSCKIWTTRIYLSHSEAHGSSSSLHLHILQQDMKPHQSKRQKLCST